ncbi:MAG: hypothetical protein H0Z39_10740 [Peptococcaceae bacterium]|nr:hypothetical protein [Peptococcaceae bacterium]
MIFMTVVFLGLLVVSGCGTKDNVKPIAEKVASIYHEPNPQIVRIVETRTECDGKPMYIVFIKGNFRKGNLKASYISFSMLANGEKVWCLKGFNKDQPNRNVIVWEDDDVEIK